MAINKTRFIGIDEQFIGNGIDDASTQPWDMLLEHLLDNNEQWIAERRDWCQHNLEYEPSAAPRKVSSADWTAIAYKRIRLRKSSRKQHFSIWMQIGERQFDIGEVGTAEIDARLRVLGTDAVETVRFSTATAGAKLFDLTLDLPGDFHGETWILFEIKGVPSVTLASQTEGTNVVNLGYGGIADPNDGSIPMLDLVAADTAISTLTYSVGDLRDPLALAPYAPGVVHAVPVAPSDQAFATSNSPSVVALSYVRPYSWQWREDHDPTAVQDGYRGKLEWTMRGGENVLGRHVVQHWTNLTSLKTRPETRALGPSGFELRGVSSTWKDGIARWPRVYGDALNPVTIWRQPVDLRYDKARLTVNLEIAFGHIVDRLTRIVGYEEAYTMAASAEWQFEARIRQFPSSGSDLSSASTVAAKTLTASFDHPAIASSSTFGLHRQMWWSWHHKGEAGRDHYTFREGQLYPHDLALTESVSLQLDYTDPGSGGLQYIEVEALPFGSWVYKAGTAAFQNPWNLTAWLIHADITKEDLS